MHTELVNISNQTDWNTIMIEAGRIIKNGGLVAFPTETVYGLGGDGLNPQSSQKIYTAKGRPSDNPLIIHIARKEDVTRLVQEVTWQGEQLIDAFWPGPLTLIMAKSEVVPLETTGGLYTVAVRMPDHPGALAFIKEAGGYVAAPSANVSGKPSPTLAKYVLEDMDGKIDMILDGGLVGIGIESTIVDLTSQVPRILRPGAITPKMIEAVIGKVEHTESTTEQNESETPIAPGMKYKHYAPKGKMTIVQGESLDVVCTINRHTTRLQEKGERVGVIATNETAHGYLASHVKSVGSRQDEASIARRLYQILREFDDEGMTYIYSEAFAISGMGQAIMNRLLKAAGYHVEEAMR